MTEPRGADFSGLFTRYVHSVAILRLWGFAFCRIWSVRPFNIRFFFCRILCFFSLRHPILVLLSIYTFRLSYWLTAIDYSFSYPYHAPILPLSLLPQYCHMPYCYRFWFCAQTKSYREYSPVLANSRAHSSPILIFIFAIYSILRELIHPFYILYPIHFYLYLHSYIYSSNRISFTVYFCTNIVCILYYSI